jgi:hypothetical protein
MGNENEFSLVSSSPHPFLFILGEYQFAPTDHPFITLDQHPTTSSLKIPQ